MVQYLHFRILEFPLMDVVTPNKDAEQWYVLLF
jgi:hypothetical protein